MSYGGYEYNDRGFGFDPMSGMGGFTSDNMGGGFMAEDGNKGKGSEKKGRDKQSLLPVTIKQLLNAARIDDSFKIDDTDVNTLKLIGTLNNPVEQSTNFNFKLNDGTGSIDCKFWIDQGTGFNSQLKDGMMVRVIGNLREYDGRLHVLVFDISPLEDWNELSYHMLDVILTHLQNTRGPIPGANNAMVPGQTPGQFTPGALGKGPSGVGMSLNHMSINESKEDIIETVYDIYRTSGANEVGLAIQDVSRILKSKGSNIPFDKLQLYVARLCDDGRLYTSVDEDHHCPTEF